MPDAPADKVPPDWDQRYQEGDTPWCTTGPSLELASILEQYQIPRGRILELGCGEGVNAVYLSQLGFEVTAVDISPTAIDRARARAEREGVTIDFHVADVTALPDLPAPFPFVFDRGVYHVVRRTNLEGLLATLEQMTSLGSHYLTMAGNANEQTPEGQQGPPRVTAAEICGEFQLLMQLIQLREFRFDGSVDEEMADRPLAWSALFRRR